MRVEKLLLYAKSQIPYYRYLVLVIEKVLGSSICVSPQLIDGEIPARHFPFSRQEKKDTFFFTEES